MAKFENGQTCLEYRGINARHEQQARSDYNAENPYSSNHKDAISDGDPLGKGSSVKGHGHYLPDCTKPTGLIDYSNFDTSPSSQIGGVYDIDGRGDIPGRKVQMARSMYDASHPYGSAYINTEANVNDGQYVVK